MIAADIVPGREYIKRGQDPKWGWVMCTAYNPITGYVEHRPRGGCEYVWRWTTTTEGTFLRDYEPYKP